MRHDFGTRKTGMECSLRETLEAKAAKAGHLVWALSWKPLMPAEAFRMDLLGSGEGS